jgi:hypothetical protein
MLRLMVFEETGRNCVGALEQIAALQHNSTPAGIFPLCSGPIRGVSRCEPSYEGLYFPEAKGGQQMDQRTGSDAYIGLGNSHHVSIRGSVHKEEGNVISGSAALQA